MRTVSLFTVFLPDTPLPHGGSSYEKASLDLKGTYLDEKTSKLKTFEMAKDIAAFANGMGGTILVGGYEDTNTGLVGTYKAMSSEEAKTRTRDIDNAVADRCRPRPYHVVERLPGCQVV